MGLRGSWSVGRLTAVVGPLHIISFPPHRTTKRSATAQTSSLPIHPVPSATMGSVVLPHLVTGWHVDQAIMSEEERLVVIRFGRDWDPDCMRQDEVLYSAFLTSSSLSL